MKDILLIMIICLIISQIIVFNVNIKANKENIILKQQLNNIQSDKKLKAIIKCNDNITTEFFTKCVAWELDKKGD